VLCSIHAVAENNFIQIPVSQSGVRFVNRLNETEELNILNYEYYYNGGGVAAGDINNDGKADLYFIANIGPNKLYVNRGDFNFQDVTDFAGVAGAQGWKTGVTMADVNADGWLDIYVCHSGKLPAEMRRNELFINNKDLTFTERAAEFGLDDNSCSTQAAFFDFDKDGDLDMYLLNHNITTFKNFDIREMREKRDPIAGDKLYLNDNGRYRDISEQAGIRGSAIGFGLGIAVGDIDNDGWQDIYVANDYTEPDYLYINNGDGTFTDRMREQMEHISQFAMGCDMADFNNDGWNDLVTLDMLPEDNPRQKEMRGPANYDKYWLQVRYGYHHQVMRNTLQLNNRNGTFSEIGQMAGISNTDWSWTPLLVDFDNDGWKDLFITNGYRRNYINMDFLKYTYEDAKAKARAEGGKTDLMELVNQIPSIDIPNYYFHNNGDLTFSDKSKPAGITENSLSGGATAVDLDNDGDKDLVVNNINQPAFVYRNETSAGNSYIRFRFAGAGKNTFGIGCKVEIRCGDLLQQQELQTTKGYQSSAEPILSFGTGNHATIDEVSVTWPDGNRQTLKNLKTRQSWTFHEMDAKPRSDERRSVNSKTLFATADTLAFRHEENSFVDFKNEFLLPHRLSTLGPKITMGDVNGDGKEDFYIGNAAGAKGGLFISSGDGFIPSAQPALYADSLREDGESFFFDADGDKDLDLLVVSGGNEFEDGSEELADRLYLNDGKGIFLRSEGLLPADTIAGLCVAGADFDADGDQDLFIGGCVRHDAGMVMDACWSDMDGDGRKDLVVAGEWMPVRIFFNRDGHLTEQSMKGIPNSSGWWNFIGTADLDADGDEDILGGNRGDNAQMKASPLHPARLYIKDFDGNGTIDPIITYWIKDGYYPMASRDELLDQLLPLRKKYIYYSKYAYATIDSIFSPAQLKDVIVREAVQFKSVWFENDGHGNFTQHELPNEAQMSAVNAAVTADLDGDKKIDILLAGNNYGLRAEMGRDDASYGLFLKGDGKGGFRVVPSDTSGLLLRGECRELKMVRSENKSTMILAGMNDLPLQMIRIRK
jgi:hypothetical protein